MKRYTITKVDQDRSTIVTVFVGQDKFFTIPKDEQSKKLVPGDKIGIMYDNIIGTMPVAYIYNGGIDMGAFAPCESMGGECYVGKLKLWDKPLFNFIAMKNIVAGGKKPCLAAWRNAQILAGINTKKRIR
ncbi:MAG: hypothetical protein J6S74_00665 [Alphaproteobacteria bacterium]|nr:hypothetical protein [Alphaproteobacteria bacterium]